MALTRSYLFRIAKEALINNDILRSSFSNPDLLIDLFSFSENYSNLLEHYIDASHTGYDNFNRLKENIINEIRNISLLTNKISKSTIDFFERDLVLDNDVKPEIIYERIFLKLNSFVNRFFNKKDLLFNETDAFNESISNMPKTFLSYAYDDKLLSLALFIYFYINDGYLYIDWMHHDEIDDAKELKEDITFNLQNSVQFLLLRTFKSEFRKSYKKDITNIRQWCAWEIGNYYSVNPNAKFYTSFFEENLNMGLNKNIMLDTFNILHYVRNGKMY